MALCLAWGNKSSGCVRALNSGHDTWPFNLRYSDLPLSPGTWLHIYNIMQTGLSQAPQLFCFSLMELGPM